MSEKNLFIRSCRETWKSLRRWREIRNTLKQWNQQKMEIHWRNEQQKIYFFQINTHISIIYDGTNVHIHFSLRYHPKRTSCRLHQIMQCALYAVFTDIHIFFFKFPFSFCLQFYFVYIRIKKIGKERETKNFLKKIFSINFCLCSLCVASLYVYEPIWAKWKQHETYKYSIFYTFKKRRKKKLNKSWKNWCKRNKKRGKILNLLV